jgi:hypothetical protein
VRQLLARDDWGDPARWIVGAAVIAWLAAELGRWIYDPDYWFPWE